MPIKTRIDMLSNGIKTLVGIKILEPDLEILAGLGEQIESLLRDKKGTLSVFSERVTGGIGTFFLLKEVSKSPKLTIFIPS